MNRYVSDTHPLLWHLSDSTRLGENAKRAFEEGIRGLAEIYIPAIVLAELYYANVKLGLPLDFPTVFRLLNSSRQYVLLPMHPSDMTEFDIDVDVPEMHDRMIAGVARRLGLPLITRDRAIVGSKTVSVVW